MTYTRKGKTIVRHESVQLRGWEILGAAGLAFVMLGGLSSLPFPWIVSTVPRGQEVPVSANLGLGGIVGWLQTGQWRWW